MSWLGSDDANGTRHRCGRRHRRSQCVNRGGVPPALYIQRKTAAQRCGVEWPWNPFYYAALVDMHETRLTPGEFRALLIVNGMAVESAECVTDKLAPRV